MSKPSKAKKTKSKRKEPKTFEKSVDNYCIYRNKKVCNLGFECDSCSYFNKHISFEPLAMPEDEYEDLELVYQNYARDDVDDFDY